MTNDFEINSFTAKVRKDGDSSVITIPVNVKKYEGIKDGSWVKVMVKKLPEKEE